MVNFWAVLVAAIASMVIGGIWWGPLFGKLWMKENGFDQMSQAQRDAMRKSMAGSYVQQFIISFIEAWVLAYVLVDFGSSGAGEAIKYAALLWLGFVFPIQYGQRIWGGKSFKFVFLTLLSSLITLGVMGAIVGVWR